jgi:hypothetical protein
MRLAMVIVIALAGCATLAAGQTYSEEEMMTAAAALTKVSAAAEANLRYGTPSDTLSDAEFLAQSVAHDPGLLRPVSAYQIKATRQGGNVAILVCSQDGTVALLEDAGCTAAMDRHRWRDDPRSPCAFTIDLALLCPSAPN